MHYERLKKTEQPKSESQLIQSSLFVISLITLLKISLGGIRIIPRSTTAVDALEKRGLANKLEKRVQTVLKEILDPLGIEISHETLRILATHVDIDKIRTDPDFFFQYGGAAVFIEVGRKNNSSSKKNQLRVVKRGINTPGPKPAIIYVQLSKKDVINLEKIAKDLPSLMNFLKTARKRVVYP